MNKNKQLAINMIAQLVSFAVSILINFFLTPFIVDNVGVDAFGFVGLANNFISYATIITVALNSMAGRFVTIEIHRENHEEANKYFTSVFVGNIIISAVLAVVALMVVVNLEHLINVPERIITDVKLLMGLLFANFIFGVIGNIFSVATFARNRLELSSMRSIESTLLKVAVLAVAFFLFEPAVWYVGLATLVCGLYVILTNVYYTKKLVPNLKIKKKYYDFNKIKDLIVSGIWNSISKISGIISTGLDLLITNLFVNASAMGVVSVASTVHGYILSTFGLISSAFMPQLTIDYAKNRNDEIKKQLISAIRLTGFLASVPIACIFVYGIDFYKLWMPNQNVELLQALTFLRAIALPFGLALEPLWNVFTVTNKVKQSSLVLMASSAISILGTFILLSLTNDENMKMYIIVGFSTLVGVIRCATFLPIMGAKCVGLKWNTFYPVMLKNLISLLIVIVISVAIRTLFNINSWMMLILAVVLTGMFALTINYYIMLTQNERTVIKKRLIREKK